MQQLNLARTDSFNPLDHENHMNGNLDPTLDQADMMIGTDEDDTLAVGRGADWIYGGLGNDRLYGGDGPDSIQGEDGQDQLDGGPGHDLIDGGRGHDSLIGGDGRDVFSWKANDYDGSDQVLDFKFGEDALLFSGLLPDGGNSEPALSRLILQSADPSSTWLIVLAADYSQEMHRIHLANTNLLADGRSDDQVLRSLYDQGVLQLF